MLANTTKDVIIKHIETENENMNLNIQQAQAKAKEVLKSNDIHSVLLEFVNLANEVRFVFFDKYDNVEIFKTLEEGQSYMEAL